MSELEGKENVNERYTGDAQGRGIEGDARCMFRYVTEKAIVKERDRVMFFVVDE
jgi:hypothetical protein